MSWRRRRRFEELVERQLDLFASDLAHMLDECDEALRAYNAAPADEAEERYADYLDLVETLADELEAIRDAFQATLDEATGERYAAEFNDLARRRLRAHPVELG